MDSDSSLDGEFETKHEIAVRSRRSTVDEAEPTKDESEDESSDSGSERGESSPIRSPPLAEQGQASPKSNNGEVSDSSDDDDDARSNASSASSNKSASSVRSARSAKSDKSYKSEKSFKSVKSDKSDKSEKSYKSDKSDRSNKSDMSDKSGKSDRSVKSDKSGKSDRSVKSDKSGKSDRSVKSNKSGKSDRSVKSDKSGKSDMSVKSDKSEMSGKSDKSGKSDRSDQSDKSDKSSKSEGSEMSDKSDRSRKSDKSDLSKPLSNVVLDDDDSQNADEMRGKGRPKTPPEIDGEFDSTPKKEEITGHGEDLSDVSDLDSNDGRDSLDAVSEDDRNKKREKKDPIVVRKEAEPVEEMEQLDFEAEEQGEKDEREEGECEGKDDKSDDEGELKGEDLEEGEITDEEENRPEETEPRPICRFYNRGQCTWGASCRFVHPGVTDKGNYTMFDMVRPLVPVNGPPIYPAMDYRAYEKPISVGVSYGAGARKEETPVYESAWERGLRQAKEMMRKSTKRKETDMDFEEKKMNLSLGQEELDKENDYYTRPASPILKEDSERWGLKDPDARYREGSVALDHYEEMPESPYYHHQSRGSAGGEYWRRVHYEPGDARAIRVEADYAGGGRSERSSSKHHSQPHQQHRTPPADYYDKYEKKSSRQKTSHSTREVIVERAEKPWRDERYAEVSMPSHRGRGDEWADPWMRSKSPTGRKVGVNRSSRRQSYSSGSSYTSSRSKSSRSSSGSESSASSSESSESSFSSSSSSREPSPKGTTSVRPAKRIVLDDRERLALAQSLKVKAMDALKLSGQKQQIKLTLKASGTTPPVNKRTVSGLPELPELNLVRRERAPVPMMAGKKRPAEISAVDESTLAAKVAALSKPASKKATTSRREELLKQLKAVEDAIARKRSKT